MYVIRKIVTLNVTKTFYAGPKSAQNILTNLSPNRPDPKIPADLQLCSEEQKFRLVLISVCTYFDICLRLFQNLLRKCTYTSPKH